MIFRTKQLEFHVVHTCNFTCEGCSHYSNHGHSGNVSLNDAEEWLYNWSRKLKPKRFVILGGEPTLHPELARFVYMVRMMYPDPYTKIDLVSNASFLHNHPDLPTALRVTDTALAISIHSTQHRDYIKRFKRGYTLAKEWRHSEKVRVEFWDFTNKHWIPQYTGYGNNIMPYQDNNPRKSWDNCISKHALQLHEGKLWKCPPLAYLPMQANKYNLNSKWDPYLKYKPLDVDCSDEELKEFLSKEDESFCSMCPANQLKPIIKKDPTLPVSYWEKIYDNMGDIVK